MEDNVKTQICHEANKKFINEALSGYDKFKYLPYWLKNKSNYLERERISPPRSQKIYKRGSIIYVDFGINVGNELSGNHFAIVLNNTDNARNGVLSVVPISSKDKKSYIEVGKIIEIPSIKHFVSHADKIESEMKCLLTALIDKRLIQDEHLSGELREIYKNGNPMSPEDAVKKMEDSGIKWDDENSVLRKINSLEEERKAYRKVFLAYQKYSKNSFVMPLSIQTISKDRIRQINKFDPSGKIKSPVDVMIKIDNAIIKNYTKCNG
ncbi:MAG: type II toxin-antitoxin system PemK/MazF family toxin [Vagococcus sp.]|uniref:type II toxin-antitoxin system PemK/MazF family toxin n=1 Tax=Vagococcus sp. TaxID=1933889 RepID=UPI002FC9E007